jgi:UDP-N-acetylmuramate dehydrogenase
MQVHENYSLRKYNTFDVAAVAKRFATFFSEEELKECLQEYKSVLPKMILGGRKQYFVHQRF